MSVTLAGNTLIHAPKKCVNVKGGLIDMPKLICSEEQFHEYVGIQQSGIFNMLDPQARASSTLDKDEWFNIVSNYEEYVKYYGMPKEYA